MSHCTANKKAASAFVRRNSIPTTGAVAKALFNSAIGIDVHHDILVCAYCNVQENPWVKSRLSADKSKAPWHSSDINI